MPQAMSCFLQLGHPWPVTQPLRDVCLSHFPSAIWGASSPPGHPHEAFATLDLGSSVSGTSTRGILLPSASTAVSRAPGLSCRNSVMAGLLHHPDRKRLLSLLSQTWAWENQEETGQKQQTACGHGISQHLKRRSRRTPKSAWTGEGETADKAWLLWMDAQTGQRSWLTGQPGATSLCRRLK